MGCYWNTCKGSFWSCRLEGCIAYEDECIYEGGEHYNPKKGCKYMLPIKRVPDPLIKEDRELKMNEKHDLFLKTWFEKYSELPKPEWLFSQK